MEKFAKMSNFLDFMIHETHKVDIMFSELSKSKCLKLKFVLTKRVCKFLSSFIQFHLQFHLPSFCSDFYGKSLMLSSKKKLDKIGKGLFTLVAHATHFRSRDNLVERIL